MFLSHHQHSIDEKGRMTIPANYREQLQDGAYITQGFDQNLIVLPKTSFENISTRINKMSLTNPDARQLSRLIFSHAEEIEFLTGQAAFSSHFSCARQPHLIMRLK